MIDKSVGVHFFIRYMNIPIAALCFVWLQFIISRDGACGLNYEHSPSEGIAVVQLIEHLLKYMYDEICYLVWNVTGIIMITF